MRFMKVVRPSSVHPRPWGSDQLAQDRGSASGGRRARGRRLAGALHLAASVQNQCSKTGWDIW